MPLYEYECSACHHRFENIEPVTAPAQKRCPKCGQAAERLLAPPAIQFKGSGWYVTDYARKQSTPASSGDGGGKSAGSGAEKGTTEKLSAETKD